MTIKQRFSWIRGSTSGQVLPIVAVGIIVFMGMGALAMDVGLILLARTEAQRTADAAALAGAGMLVGNPNGAAIARAEAMDVALQNPIRGSQTILLPEDVAVIPDSQKVRVHVRRTADRGNPVETLFARVLGIPRVSVSAQATAQAWSATGVNCLMPFALPDRWSESSAQPFVWPEETDRYEGPNDDDLYIPWDPGDPNAMYTGYSAADLGVRMRIRVGNSSENVQPWWFFPFRFPGASGGSSYRDHLARCIDPSSIFEVGSVIDVQREPGEMVGPTRQGFQDLYNLDPGAYWDDACMCVRGSSFGVSPRIRPVGLFDPRYPPPSGSHPFRITNFIAVFVEAPVQGSRDFWVRFVQYTGVLPAPASNTGSPSLLRVLRLVE
jgi:hypothetical protein